MNQRSLHLQKSSSLSLSLPVTSRDPFIRFGGILPGGTVNLDTRLNTELVEEVITVLHASSDKKLDLLVGMLLAESEELDGLEVRGKEPKSVASCLSSSFSVSSVQPREWEVNAPPGRTPRNKLPRYVKGTENAGLDSIRSVAKVIVVCRYTDPTRWKKQQVNTRVRMKRKCARVPRPGRRG